MVILDEKVIAKAMQEVYEEWKQKAKKQEKINWKKRSEEIEQEIENIEKILKGG